MEGHFSELNNILVLGLAGNASATPLVSQYVHGAQAKTVDFTAFVGVGLAATSANQITVEILEADDDVGTNPVVVPFQFVYQVKGSTLLVDGTGISAKTEQVDGNGVPSRQVSFVSDVADGLKQMQITVPVRQRMRNPLKPYIAMRITTGSQARTVSFVALRCEEQYGVEGQPSLLGN
jgi:hypothetical protein